MYCRAGRADKPGKVLIQTQLPEHPVFAAVKAQDYAVFAENELNERQLFAMPPRPPSVPTRRALPMRWNFSTPPKKPLLRFCPQAFPSLAPLRC